MPPSAASGLANPFPGLRPFLESEEHLFFGRESQIDAMVDKLARNRFLAVVGTSGSGKSSLVNCGLRPALHRGLMAAAGSSWRMAQFRPGSNPVGAMARALAEDRVLFHHDSVGALPVNEIVEATLRMSKLGLADIYEQAQLAEGTNLLVVVDQFEELFRYRKVGASSSSEEQSRSQDATAFVNLLLESKAQRVLPIYVVLTMRSDFLGDCAQLPGLPEAINDGQYLVPRMTRDDRRAAIAGPIGVGRAEIDPVLLTRLVNDVGDNPDQLSILQHALNRTWARWKREAEGQLALPHYEAIGTMAHALDQHAEKAYGELGADGQQRTCERFFKALTDRGTDARGIRRPTRLARLCAIAQVTPAQAIAVVDVFRKPSRSFLMPPLSEALDADAVVDISHESLMRVWERLKRWSDEEAQSAQLYRRLSETAALHADGKAGPWRDPELQLALDWRERERPTAHWAEQYGGGFDKAMTFLGESERVRQEEIRQKDARQQRDLEHEKTLALAGEQQLRLTMQLKSARRLRWFVMALGVMFLATLLSSVWAFTQRASAVEAARTALAALEQAKYQENQARYQEKRAVEQVAIADAARQGLADSFRALSTIGGKKAVEAIVDSKSAALVPRVYMHIVDNGSRAHAESTGKTLREAGFTVLGIELVERAAARLRTTEVRYYKKMDELEAKRLVQLLQAAGDASANPVYLKDQEDNDNVRPNHFEVWFPRRSATE